MIGLNPETVILRDKSFFSRESYTVLNKRIHIALPWIFICLQLAYCSVCARTDRAASRYLMRKSN
jgi:hypothetical protein